MPSIAITSPKAAPLGEAMRLCRKIAKLQEELAAILAEEAASVSEPCAIPEAQMKKAARNLHARAEKKIASGAARQYTGDIEGIL